MRLVPAEASRLAAGAHALAGTEIVPPRSATAPPGGDWPCTSGTDAARRHGHLRAGFPAGPRGTDHRGAVLAVPGPRQPRVHSWGGEFQPSARGWAAA